MNTVFKIVRVNEFGKRLSSSVPDGMYTVKSIFFKDFNLVLPNPNKYCLIYPINKIVEAPAGTLLFAFDSFHAAHKYALERWSSISTLYREIYEAETDWFAPIKSECTSNDVNYLENYWNGIEPYATVSAPEGTVGCKTIKLTKKLWGSSEGQIIRDNDAPW